jgi:succinoglycan biosynthesis protein ExoM
MVNATASPVDISICLCTFNRQGQLSNALNSIIAQRTENTFSFEIVIVDDESTDATADVVWKTKEYSPVPLSYFWQSNAGVAVARNRCVKEAAGEWIAFFDDDQIASPEWLFSLYREALHSGAECVGGPCHLLVDKSCGVKPVGTVRKLLGENPFMANSPSILSRLHPSRRTSAIPGTGNALVKKTVFQRLGGFREGLRYGEDFEFFQRVARAGTKIAIAPKASVQHVIPASRLSLDHLLPLAARGARFQADCDSEYHGRKRLLYTSGLRCVHLIGWILPGLLVSYLFKDRDMLLAKKCSLRFTIEYLHRALNLCGSKVTDVYH